MFVCLIYDDDEEPREASQKHFIEQHRYLLLISSPYLVCPSGGVFNGIFNLCINSKQTLWFFNFNLLSLFNVFHSAALQNKPFFLSGFMSLCFLVFLVLNSSSFFPLCSCKLVKNNSRIYLSQLLSRNSLSKNK